MQKNHILKKFNRLEEKRQLLIEDLSKMSDEEFNKIPETGGWSIQQTLSHIYQAEQLSFNYIKKKTSSWESLKTANITSGLKSQLLVFTLKSPIKFKAPAMVADDLPSEEKLDEIDKNWKTLRVELEEFVDVYPPEHLNRLILRHPVGMLTLSQAFSFFNAHQERHIRQIQRIRKNIT